MPGLFPNRKGCSLPGLPLVREAWKNRGLRAGKPTDKRSRWMDGWMDDPSHGVNNVGELGFSSYIVITP